MVVVLYIYTIKYTELYGLSVDDINMYTCVNKYNFVVLFN